MADAKRDRRPTLTLKGESFSPEFRSLLNKAAKRAGKTQAEFSAQALSAAARAVLSGTPGDTPQHNPPPPPAVLAQIEDAQKRQKETDAKLDALIEQVTRLTEVQSRSLWARLRGK